MQKRNKKLTSENKQLIRTRAIPTFIIIIIIMFIIIM